MLFASWEVRIVKNSDRGLENAAQGYRLQAASSGQRPQFFTIQTDPKLANNMFISCSKLVLQIASGFVYTTLYIELASAPSTNDIL